jgi:hypothetical protein
VNSPSSSSSCIGPHPVHICCPNCHANVITDTRRLRERERCVAIGHCVMPVGDVPGSMDPFTP